jgi:signal transduction histidine kinase
MVTGNPRRDRPLPGVGGLAGGMSDDLLSRLETALWVYDFAAGRIVWANAAALALWDAPSVDALSSRDMRVEMSASVKTRLAQHYEDFLSDPDREIREFWTLYPNNTPFRVRAILRRCHLPEDSIGMLVEARAEDLREPATVRSADALLHTQTMVALFARDESELYANPAFRAAFGPGKHFFGRNFSSPADLIDFEEGMRQNGEHKGTVRVRTVNGERWHMVHAIRCRDAFTGEGAFMINATDVTEARDQQQALKEARDFAEAAVGAKSQFLANMSHEMRTPLNGVLGMASLLATSSLDDQQRQMLSVIQQSGQQMLGLVENVLELVALDSKSVELSFGEFRLDLLVGAAVGAHADAASDKGLRMITVIGDVPEGMMLKHDASRIGKVLRELIANAVKFTEKGAISIRAEIVDGHAIRFEVADSGIGIPRTQVGQVFSRFFQVDGSSTRTFGGAGVGLSICREVVDLWDGQIGVNSDEGRGSVFWFTVPDAVAPAEPAAPPGRETSRSYLRLIDTQSAAKRRDS